MTIVLTTLLVLVVWFAWSIWTLFKKLGSAIEPGNTKDKDTWLDYVAVAPAALALVIVDKVSRFAIKHCK